LEIGKKRWTSDKNQIKSDKNYKKGQQWRTQQKQLPAKGHMTLSQVPAVCEKNIFHLFRFTQPVENNTSHTPLVAMPGRPPQRQKV